MRAAVLGVLMICLSTPGIAAAEIGRIKTLVQPASVVRRGATTTAALGAPLEAGDVLVTGRAGSVGITFIDNSRFAVGPNTRLALSQFTFNDTTHRGAFLTTLDRGSLAVVSGQIAKENKDAMRVRTPTAVLAARGTRFVVEVK